MKSERSSPSSNAWARPWKDLIEVFQVPLDSGLDAAEVKRRRHKYGANRLKETAGKSVWTILVNQLENLIVALLAVAAILSFSLGKWLEGISVTIAIIVNAAIGFFTEWRAVRSMESLRRMSRVTAKVRRDGTLQEVPSEMLVPGDIVLLEAGDIVSADLRLVEASRLGADESTLTGESTPVTKQVSPLEEDIPLADRTNMLFKGTSVTEGSGQGVVVATGMDTELGKIATLAEEAEEEQTPLEKRLNRLGYRLIWITVGIALLIVGTGVLMQQEFFLIVETAIALAVAAIPEGLPIVATIALARGMWRMARHNALMNRLSAVETLGATSIICTDKTGTLTENRLTLSKILFSQDEDEDLDEVTISNRGNEDETFFLKDQPVNPSEFPPLREILEIGVLCNNAGVDRESPTEMTKAVGDPLEVALLVAGAHAGIRREELLETSLPEVREEAFHPDTMMMATFHELQEGRYWVAVKGEPGPVLNASSRMRTPEGERELSGEEKDRWAACNDRLAESGLRVLAVASKSVDTMDAPPYEALTFTGLLGLMDPPREDVREPLEECHKAGIRVIMVTGDQPPTAKNIGLNLGLISDDGAPVIHGRELKDPQTLSQQKRERLLKAPIFARVSPEQKLDLIELQQEAGSVVAMTGDGVNDAPALKKADIGIAMGKRGTQVAREAADMVLKDDAFKTIVLAIQQGRAIFDNIRKFIVFLLSGNVGEIMIVAFALLVGAPLPILPLQILYLNMIGDVFPDLALGVGKGDPSKMERPPRDAKEPILTNHHWIAIVGYGLLIALPVLGAFGFALRFLELDLNRAVTISFLTLAFARLWHVFNMRDRDSNLFKNDVTSNPFVWGALLLCTGLLTAAVYTPGLSFALRMVDPGRVGWALILGASLIPLLIGQVWKRLRTGF
jgi:Ca2+-transporting ATPase